MLLQPREFSEVMLSRLAIGGVSLFGRGKSTQITMLTKHRYVGLPLFFVGVFIAINALVSCGIAFVSLLILFILGTSGKSQITAAVIKSIAVYVIAFLNSLKCSIENALKYKPMYFMCNTDCIRALRDFARGVTVTTVIPFKLAQITINSIYDCRFIAGQNYCDCVKKGKLAGFGNGSRLGHSKPPHRFTHIPGDVIASRGVFAFPYYSTGRQ